MLAQAEAFGIHPTLTLGTGTQTYVLVSLWSPFGTTTKGWLTLYGPQGEAAPEQLAGIDPRRLDLPDRHCQLAREIGVPVALVSRASRPEELERMRYAVDHARRGWLEAGDTLNARPLAELRKALR